MTRSIFPLRFRGLVCALTASICVLRGADAATPGGEILVKGTGLSITRAELDAEVGRQEMEVTNRGEALTDETRAQLQAQLLDRMIFRRLMASQATEADKRRAWFEANAYVAGTKSEAPTPEAFTRRLKRLGFTEETFAADKYAEILAATVVDRRVRAGIRIDDSAIQAAYVAQPERWEKPAVIRGLDLVVGSKDPVTGAELEGAAREEKLKQARALRARASKGEDFSGLVKRFSEDSRGRELGGAFTLAKAGAAPELEQSLAALKPGEVSDVLETPTGFHVVKVLEVSAAEMTPLVKATATIRAELTDAEFKKQLTAFVSQLWREAGVNFAPGAPRLPKRE